MSASKGSVECMHLKHPMKRMKRETSHVVINLDFKICSDMFHNLSDFLILPTCQVSDGTAEAEDIRGRHREQQLQGQLLQHRGQRMSQFLVIEPYCPSTDKKHSDLLHLFSDCFQTQSDEVPSNQYYKLQLLHCRSLL